MFQFVIRWTEQQPAGGCFLLLVVPEAAAAAAACTGPTRNCSLNAERVADQSLINDSPRLSSSPSVKGLTGVAASQETRST